MYIESFSIGEDISSHNMHTNVQNVLSTHMYVSHTHVTQQELKARAGLRLHGLFVFTAFNLYLYVHHWYYIVLNTLWEET